MKSFFTHFVLAASLISFAVMAQASEAAPGTPNAVETSQGVVTAEAFGRALSQTLNRPVTDVSLTRTLGDRIDTGYSTTFEVMTVHFKVADAEREHLFGCQLIYRSRALPSRSFLIRFCGSETASMPVLRLSRASIFGATRSAQRK